MAGAAYFSRATAVPFIGGSETDEPRAEQPTVAVPLSRLTLAHSCVTIGAAILYSPLDTTACTSLTKSPTDFSDKMK